MVLEQELPQAHLHGHLIEGRFRDQMNYIPGKCIYLAYFLSFLIIYGVILGNTRLPIPLMKKDADAHPGAFIAEYAFFELRQLTEFGPKVAGSYENEVLAADFLHREITYIIQQAKRVHVIEVDIQKPMGCFLLGFEPDSFVNCYGDVQNIIVKLSSHHSSGHSLLINCHFDSVPGSPGSSDDALNCAVMLEVLRVLSQTRQSLKHNVIFLFNGAEETPLQASHGFITQHRWAKQVRAFVNLEACGAGGREILFQAAPNHPWLINHYASSVPHPHGLVVAEELFQSGLVPSDTDYRIFRDFGRVPGLDFAHNTNGYVYHTKFDNLDYIPLGTLQHTGDNLLALTKAIASSDELEDTGKHSGQRTVYFDLFGLLMVTYGEFTGSVVNGATVLLSLYSQWKVGKEIGKGAPIWLTVKVFFMSCESAIYGWLLGSLVCLLIAIFIDSVNAAMSWYSHPSLIVPLYFFPMIMSCTFIYISRRNYLTRSLKPVEQAQIYSAGVQLLWCALLVLTTHLELRSSFVLMLLLGFPAIGNLLLLILKKKQSLCMWLMVYIASVTIPVTFVLYQTVLGFNLFIPITGRMGPSSKSEIFIAALSVLTCVLLVSYYTPLIVLFKKPKKILSQLGCLHLLTLLAVILTPLSFPYSGDPAAPAPKRIMIHHTSQKFYDHLGHLQHNASGFWIIDLDCHNSSYLEPVIPELAKAETVKQLCEEVLYCGLPLFSPRLRTLCEETVWLPAGEPVVHIPTLLRLHSRRWLSHDILQMSLGVTGPDRIEVFLSPNPNVKVMNWSFTSAVPSGKPEWKNRATYFIHYTSGVQQSGFNFSLDLKVSSSSDLPVVDIAVVGHYLNNQKLSEDFRLFLEKYPEWAHINAITSTYSSWKF